MLGKSRYKLVLADAVGMAVLGNDGAESKRVSLHDFAGVHSGFLFCFCRRLV
jgi:hypothetical protein